MFPPYRGVSQATIAHRQHLVWSRARRLTQSSPLYSQNVCVRVPRTNTHTKWFVDFMTASRARKQAICVWDTPPFTSYLCAHRAQPHHKHTHSIRYALRVSVLYDGFDVAFVVRWICVYISARKRAMFHQRISDKMITCAFVNVWTHWLYNNSIVRVLCVLMGFTDMGLEWRIPHAHFALMMNTITIYHLCSERYGFK